MMLYGFDDIVLLVITGIILVGRFQHLKLVSFPCICGGYSSLIYAWGELKNSPRVYEENCSGLSRCIRLIRFLWFAGVILANLSILMKCFNSLTVRGYSCITKDVTEIRYFPRVCGGYSITDELLSCLDELFPRLRGVIPYPYWVDRLFLCFPCTYRGYSRSTLCTLRRF